MQGLKKTNPIILTICGSPHKDGNTATALDMLYAELIEIPKMTMYAYDLRVEPCTGCGFCSKEFSCMFHDSMGEMYSLLKQCKILIVASPIYFSHFPAPLKAVIDRCQVFWEYYMRGNPSLGMRCGLALLIGAGNYDTMFVPGVITLRHLFNSLQVAHDEKRYLKLPNINNKKDLENDDIRVEIKNTADYIKKIVSNL